LGLVITAWLLYLFAATSIWMLVLVYQSEIRYALIHLDPFRSLVRPTPRGPTSDNIVIAEAAFALAEARRGALIVLRRRGNIDHLLTGGVPLGGQISREILEAIFRKVSPVHDGATVIEGGYISRVGVFLPLTSRIDLPNFYGSRHRAALGLTEQSDAVVIVASEERGEVSLVQHSTISQMYNVSALIDLLQSLDPRAPLISGRKSHHQLLRYLKLKFLALGIAPFLLLLMITPGLFTLRDGTHLTRNYYHG